MTNKQGKKVSEKEEALAQYRWFKRNGFRAIANEFKMVYGLSPKQKGKK